MTNLVPRCQQCGSESQETSVVEMMGKPWRHIRQCLICGVAAEGRTQEEALRNFRDGRFTLERKP